jgi:hypothetical protein
LHRMQQLKRFLHARQKQQWQQWRQQAQHL